MVWIRSQVKTMLNHFEFKQDVQLLCNLFMYIYSKYSNTQSESDVISSKTVPTIVIWEILGLWRNTQTVNVNDTNPNIFVGKKWIALQKTGTFHTYFTVVICGIESWLDSLLQKNVHWHRVFEGQSVTGKCALTSSHCRIVYYRKMFIDTESL